MRRDLLEALVLKDVDREGWKRVVQRAPESVAAHCWGVAWLVLTLCPEHLDRERALAISLIHDLPEARVGDINPHDGVPKEAKAELESAALDEMTACLPTAEELRALWHEYEDASSPEGRFVKALDKLDMALQAERYRALEGVDTDEFIDAARRSIEALAERDPWLAQLLAHLPEGRA